MSSITGFSNARFRSANKPVAGVPSFTSTGLSQTPIIAAQPTFSGELPRRIGWLPLTLLAVVLGLGGVGGNAPSAVAQSGGGGQGQTSSTLYSDVLPSGEPVGPICEPGDLPHLRGVMDQDIIDTFNTPLFDDPETRAAAQAIVDRLESSQNKEIQVLVVPRLDCDETNDLQILNRFSTDAYYHLGLNQRNGGIVLVIDESRMRENQSGKIFMKPDDVWSAKFSSTVTNDILVNYAKGHIDEGDYDGAVKAALQGVEDYLTSQGRYASPAQAPPAADSPAGLNIKREVIFGILGAIALAAGAAVLGSWGYAELQQRKDDEERVNRAFQALRKEDEPPFYHYNVYNTETVAALLESASNYSATGLEPYQKDYVENALDIMMGRLTKRNQRKALDLALEQGINHPILEIQNYFLTFAKKSFKPGQRQEVIDSFLAQIAQEDERSTRFISYLANDVVELLPAEAAEQMDKDLAHPHWGRRLVAALALLNPNVFNPQHTLELLFNRLETESHKTVVREIREGIARNVGESPVYADFLLGKLTSESIQTRKTAVQNLGILAQERFFAPLHEQFGREPDNALDKDYTQALEAVAGSKHLKTLLTDLNHHSPRHQRLAIALFNKLNVSQAVGHLLNYIDRNEPPAHYPDPARKVAVRLANESHYELAAAKLQSENKTARLAAVEILGKAANPQAIPALLKAYDHEMDSQQREALYQAILQCGKNDADLTFLKKGFKSYTSDSVRIAILDGMAEQGSPAVAPMMEYVKAPRSLGVSPDVLQHIQTTIAKLYTDGDGSYDYLKPYLSNSNTPVAQIASEGIRRIIQHWSEKGSYDSKKTMAELAELAAAEDIPRSIKTAADTTRNTLVQKKAKQLKGLGGSLDAGRYYDSNVSDLEKYKKAPEQEIREAATSALSELSSRHTAWKRKQKSSSVSSFTSTTASSIFSPSDSSPSYTSPSFTDFSSPGPGTSIDNGSGL